MNIEDKISFLFYLFGAACFAMGWIASTIVGWYLDKKWEAKRGH